ncbi:MAG: hypothetical protein KDA80_01270 [Planctomycetaceae bacterium]|nr:hypothetical protein [Planctomycetaceae bacterium]
MNGAWAMRMPTREGTVWSRLRLTPGIEFADEDGVSWLRGPELTDDLKRRLFALPVGDLFDVLPDGQLRFHGRRVPVARLPELRWRPLRDTLPLELPPSTFPGRVSDRVPLTLVRSTVEQPANLLVLPFSEFAAWGLLAPEIRLGRLRFAVCADGRCMVSGEPLPPVLGEWYVAHDGLALPVGWTWSPAIDRQLVGQMLRLSPGDVCLWTTAGRLERVPGDQFVSGSRSSLRATARAGEGRG